MEKKLLTLSVIAAAAFALFGVVFGIIINSTMVMFDGIYSSISVILSLLSVILISRVKLHQDTERFPFGKWHFEPALLVLKSFVIMVLCIYSIGNAVLDVLNGGNLVEMKQALLYSGISTLVCTLLFLYLRAQNKTVKSDLIEAETTQWMGDSLLSLGVLIGFGITLALEGTSYAHFTPYADPVMVIIASCMFLYFPAIMFIKGAKELLFMNSGYTLQKEVHDTIEAIQHQLNGKYKIHTVKVGREVFLEVNFLINNQSLSVNQMDEIRNKIKDAMEGEVWLNVNFTTEEIWL